MDIWQRLPTTLPHWYHVKVIFVTFNLSTCVQVNKSLFRICQCDVLN